MAIIPQRKKELQTLAVLVGATALLFWLKHHYWWLLGSAALGLLGLVWPRAGALIHRYWMKLAEALGYVMNRVLLGIVFIVLVIPLGWFSRLSGKSAIRLKRLPPGAGSYYKDRDHLYTKEDLENVW